MEKDTLTMWWFDDNIDYRVVREISEFVANYIVTKIQEAWNN